MKVLVIYDSECRKDVEAFREEITERFGRDTILRISSRERPDREEYEENTNNRKIHIHKWHRDAIRLINLADMVVYYVSPNSSKNKNVEWELKKAMNAGKFIACLNIGNHPLNECITKLNNNTKEKESAAKIVENENGIYGIIEEFNNDSYINLFNSDEDGDKYDINILLEQYKMFTDSAESLVSRRLNMNSFYISANTALITIGATVFALSENQNMISKMIIILALSIPGIMLNVSWRSILHSYFINNRGKMKILSMIEKRLAVSLYDAEWKAMKNKFSKEKYKSFTESEKKLPTIFILFYIVADFAALIYMLTLL